MSRVPKSQAKDLFLEAAAEIPYPSKNAPASSSDAPHGHARCRVMAQRCLKEIINPPHLRNSSATGCMPTKR